MGAPAISRPRPATRPAPKRAPARSPRPASRPRSRPAGRSATGVVRFPANAVGRTAATVSGIADSGFVTGMARSRAWIAVLGVLLGGIVAVNVVGLSLSAAGSETSAKIDELIRDNSVQRSRLAHRLSNGQITKAADALGLAVPAADAVNYLNSSSADAKRAAERLADGSIANAPPAIGVSETTVADPAVTTTDPTVLVDPATTYVDPAVDPAAGYVDPAIAPVTTP